MTTTNGEFRTEYINNEKWFKGLREKLYYRVVSSTDSGIYILHCVDASGGSGVFHNLLMVTFFKDEFLSIIDGVVQPRKRTILKSVGIVSLGDRYSGNIVYQGGSIHISADKSLKRFGGIEKNLIINIK